ncbi:Peptide methionine sulfoxide reductase B5 [Didymosphaeria variabile]|uniref:Peptide-methionine (R)-S-oxide reductase n=1 Tax=Didymosphaeria variabile TaxID=1932322 RepID=A0A9W9C7M6_9PLEO|nr:Peptide methionine sulfoxide reductase B5 [Didymosphaeria variabile]KAJ4349640.1 Peptide methionine sulfoxide reductase B5 [Didymosphaeria variabile]
MRFPSIPTLIRTFHAFTNTTFRAANPARGIYSLPQRATLVRSMPNIPFLGALFGTKMADNTNYPIQKTEGEWQAQLSPEQFRILRKKGTEAPGSSKLDKHYPDAGVYTCAGCNAPLYKANHKFDSGCGWPAFWDAFPDAVGQRADPGLGMMRTEIVCNNCGGHLGHIFKGERFGNPKDERHCVNGVSINFSPEDKKE